MTITLQLTIITLGISYIIYTISKSIISTSSKMSNYLFLDDKQLST